MSFCWAEASPNHHPTTEDCVVALNHTSDNCTRQSSALLLPPAVAVPGTASTAPLAAGDPCRRCPVVGLEAAAAAVLACQSAELALLLCAGPVGKEQRGAFALPHCFSFSDIFREFNAMTVGYSTGTGSANDSNAFLNQAVPGAQAEYVALWFTFADDGCFN